MLENVTIERDAKKPMQVIEDTVRYQVWEYLHEQDLSSLQPHGSWFLSGSSTLRRTLDRAIRENEFAGFERILLAECPGEVSESAKPFWDEMERFASAAVNAVWMRFREQLATISQSDRIDLKRRIALSARFKVIDELELYHCPEED